MSDIVDFAHIDEDDEWLAGLSGTKLGRMARLGLPILPGFLISSHFFDAFLAANNLEASITKLLKDAFTNDSFDFFLLSQKIKQALDKASFPQELVRQINKVWRKDFGFMRPPFLISPSIASKEPMFESSCKSSFLIFSRNELLSALKECWKSWFEPSQLAVYKEKVDIFSLPKMAAIVQEQIFAEVSGVLYTHNPQQKNSCLIYAVWGLADLDFPKNHSGCDVYAVDRTNRLIISKQLAGQEKQLVRLGGKIEELPISSAAKHLQKLSDTHLQYLAGLASLVVQHYFFPQMISWTLKNNKIFISDLRLQPEDITIKQDGVQQHNPDLAQPKVKNLADSTISIKRPRTATKILLQVENEKELDFVSDEAASGLMIFFSALFGKSSLTKEDILLQLQSLLRKMNSNLLFLYIQEDFWRLSDLVTIQEMLNDFKLNFVFVYPASIWSEELRIFTQQMGVPSWVGCRTLRDILFLEQYILWGAKGVLIHLENSILNQGLPLKEDGDFKMILNQVAKIKRRQPIDTGLMLRDNALICDYLWQAVLSGFSLVAIPKKFYLWAQEEVKSAEKELVWRYHG